MIHGIGLFTIDAFAIVFWAAMAAATLAFCFGRINTAKTKGNDPDLSKIPAVGAGVVLGAIIGGVAAFMQLSSGSFLINMVGLWFIFVCICGIAVRVARRLYR